MYGIAHGPPLASSGAIGVTYSGVRRSEADRPPIVVVAPAGSEPAGCERAASGDAGLAASLATVVSPG
jgi:hypothetical protein